MPKRNARSRMRNARPGTEGHPPVVKSIYRAGNILLCLSNGVNTVTDIANRCQLSKSTVHRLLKALEESYIVSQDPLNHRYFIGPMITRLSSRPQNTHEYLITGALEEMRRLSDVSEETITLSTMTGIQYVHLSEIQSKHDLRVTEKGRRIRPLFMGATTKVLLSQLNDDKLRIALKNVKIDRVTNHTVTDKEVLMAQLREIRRQGYAVSRGEAVEGALCISARVKDYVLPVALSIVGPESRLESQVDVLIKELSASADQISRKIAGIFRAREVLPLSG